MIMIKKMSQVEVKSEAASAKLNESSARQVCAASGGPFNPIATLLPLISSTTPPKPEKAAAAIATPVAIEGNDVEEEDEEENDRCSSCEGDSPDTDDEEDDEAAEGEGQPRSATENAVVFRQYYRPPPPPLVTDRQNLCGLCHLTLRISPIVRIAICGHGFHLPCFNNSQATFCPICPGYS